MNIGFIGFGNIAKAAMQGFKNKKIKNIHNYYATSANFSTLKEEVLPFSVHPCRDNKALSSQCDVLFLCVKPDQTKEVLKEIHTEEKIIISFVAGLMSDDIEEIIPQTNHISVIPNVAMSVNCGVLLVENCHTLTQEQYKTTLKLLSKLGEVEIVDKKKMDIATVIAGCAPAFVAMFIEALGDGACRFGLDRTTAYRLASKMMEGTAKMALQNSIHPGQLKDSVCSPNGSTIRGVCELEDEGFRGAIIDAIKEIMD